MRKYLGYAGIAAALILVAGGSYIAYQFHSGKNPFEKFWKEEREEEGEEKEEEEEEEDWLTSRKETDGGAALLRPAFAGGPGSVWQTRHQRWRHQAITVGANCRAGR